MGPTARCRVVSGEGGRQCMGGQHVAAGAPTPGSDQRGSRPATREAGAQVSTREGLFQGALNRLSSPRRPSEGKKKKLESERDSSHPGRNRRTAVGGGMGHARIQEAGSPPPGPLQRPRVELGGTAGQVWAGSGQGWGGGGGSGRPVPALGKHRRGWRRRKPDINARACMRVRASLFRTQWPRLDRGTGPWPRP